MTKRILPFVVFVLLMSGCAKKADKNAFAIVVNGQAIDRAKVDQAAEILKQSIIRAYPQKSLQAMGPEIYKTAAYQLVSNIVMLGEAKKNNITYSAALIDSSFAVIKKKFPDQASFQRELTLAGQTEESMKKQYAEGMQLDSLLKKLLSGFDTVNESDCQAFYEKNRDKYVSQSKTRASQIMFPINNTTAADKKEIINKNAAEALQMIKKGSSFDGVLKKFSKDGAIGGDIGWFKKGDLKSSIEDTLTKMKLEDVSDIISTDVGLLIIKKTGEDIGTPMPYEQVRDHVRFMIDMKRKNEFVTSYVDSLVKKAKVVYNDTSLTPLAAALMDNIFQK